MRIQDFTSGAAGLKSSGRREDSSIYDALVRIKHEFDRLAARVDALETFRESVLNYLAGAGVIVKTYFLTADTTIPHPDEPPGSLIFYIFLQDATGGWTVTLPSTFVGFFPDQISTTADRLSTLIAFKSYQNQVVPAAFGIEGVITA